MNNFNLYGRVWQVYVQAEGQYRTRADNVGLFYVRNAEGTPVPLSSLVSMTSRPTAPIVSLRFNEYRTAEINATLAPGYSTRQGMRALEEVFAQTMPREMGFDYAGMSYQEQVAAQGVPPAAVFALSLLVVFLILAAQYESWSLPFGVLLGTPIAVGGALAALWLRGFDSGVFSQIGLVMIIGLAAKNAILIVEFSKAEHERGASLTEAALAAARLRLRPILMTALCVHSRRRAPGHRDGGRCRFAANPRHAPCWGVCSPLRLIAIFIIPATFYVSQRFARRPVVRAGQPRSETRRPGGRAAVPSPKERHDDTTRHADDGSRPGHGRLLARLRR